MSDTGPYAEVYAWNRSQLMIGETLRAGLPPDKIPGVHNGDDKNVGSLIAMTSNRCLRYWVLKVHVRTNKEDPGKLYDQLRQLVDKYPEYCNRLRSMFNLDCQPGWLDREFEADRWFVPKVKPVVRDE